MSFDPAIAVDRALDAAERAAFMERLAGPWEGAQPADYIDEALNADVHAAEVEAFWASTHGFDFHAGMLADDMGVPADVARAILSAASVACVAIGQLGKWGNPYSLGYRAGKWARGYLAATGAEKMAMLAGEAS